MGYETPYYLDRWEPPEGPEQDPVFYWEPAPDVVTGTPYTDGGGNLPSAGPAGLVPFLGCTVPLKFFNQDTDTGIWYSEAGTSAPMFVRYQVSPEIPGGSTHRVGEFAYGSEEVASSGGDGEATTRLGSPFTGTDFGAPPTSRGRRELEALNEQFGGRFTGFALRSYKIEDEDGNIIDAFAETEDPATDLGSDVRSIRYLMETKISELVDQLVESSLGRTTSFNIVRTPGFEITDATNIDAAAGIDASSALEAATPAGGDSY